YGLGLAYTAPPLSPSNHPFAGECLGGFTGVLLSGLGAYAIQTHSISLVVTPALAAHALVCMSMLIVHHYLDEPMDAGATPPKRTTVVALGFTNAKRYAGIMAATAAALYALLGATIQPAFFLGAAFTMPAVWIQLRINPGELRSVTQNELRVIQLGVAAGLSTAVGLAPPLWPLLPTAAVGSPGRTVRKNVPGPFETRREPSRPVVDVRRRDGRGSAPSGGRSRGLARGNPLTRGRENDRGRHEKRRCGLRGPRQRAPPVLRW